MNVAIHDCDGKSGFPNLALMKISAYHKIIGDRVEWFNGFESFDKVYSSKVFTFTQECLYLPDDTVKGGTGYGILDDLPSYIDNMFPDYSIYPNVQHAVGFLTRGCIRKCPWCIVPKKEGDLRAYRDWHEVKRHDSRDILFMDNNVLASDYGLSQMESMVRDGGVRIDFNQGLDARLVTDDVAELISKLKWIRFVRFSCDTDAMIEPVTKAVERCVKHGLNRSRIFVYVLAQDIESAEKRCLYLRDVLHVSPFAQPYRDFKAGTEPSKELKRFARFVNDKAIFKSVKEYKDYKG